MDSHNDIDEFSNYQNINIVNNNTVETNIRLLGDQTTISQIIYLLAYIRHALKYNKQTNINVKLGYNIANLPIAMDVNNQEINDYITQSEIEIN